MAIAAGEVPVSGIRTGSPGPMAPCGVEAVGVTVGPTQDGPGERGAAGAVPAWVDAGAVGPQAATAIERSPVSTEAAMRL